MAPARPREPRCSPFSGLFDCLRPRAASARRSTPQRETAPPAPPSSFFHFATPSQPSSRAEVRSAVWRLPLEVYATDAELRSWSIRDLRQEAREAPRRAPRCVGGGGDPPLPPLDKSDLVASVVHARGGEAGRSCSVCCEDFVSADTIRVLQCGHRFHLECVDRWLLGAESNHIGCPMCKAPLLQSRAH